MNKKGFHFLLGRLEVQVWENELKTNLLGEQIRILDICMILPTYQTQNHTSTGEEGY
jgi:hypothetical protein